MDPLADKGNLQATFPETHEIVGDFGPWQRRIFMLLFCMCVINVWQDMSITFLAPNVDFWCISQPELNDLVTNTSHTVDTDGNYSTSNVLLAENQTSSQGQCEVVTFDNRSVPCTEWQFNLSSNAQTIVSQWNLVCGKAWLISFSKSVYMMGYMASILITGQLSDWFGRRPIMMCSYTIMVTAAILLAFSSSHIMFLILRFFLGFGRTGLTTTGFVLLMEIVGPKWRAELGFGMQLGWSVGYIILPGIAWLVRDWFYLQLALASPTLFLVFVFWIIPESPRWLLTQRKKLKFEEVTTYAAKKNDHVMSDVMKNSLAEYWKSQTAEAKTKRKTILDVIKASHLRFKLLALLYIWIVNSFVYYELSFNTNDLAGNPYLNFFLSGIVEFPAVIGFVYAVRKFGRRKTLSLGMIVVGIFCASIIAVPNDVQWLTIMLSMLAKLCITGTYQIVYLCTAELFPTVVRNVTLGSCSTFARFGSILAPFVLDLGRATREFVPALLNAVITITAGLLVLTLPETKNRKIPDTLEEGTFDWSKSDKDADVSIQTP